MIRYAGFNLPRKHAKSDYMTELLKYHTKKGSDNMSTNTDESKRHYIADEKLGGIEREYVETDRKAVVGDFVKPSFGPSPYFGGLSLYSVVDVDADDVGDIAVYDDGDSFHVLSPGYFSTYEKTGIIRHNGERYRLVDRKAEVGEIILINEINQNTMRDMTVGGTYMVFEKPIYPCDYVNVSDDVETVASAFDGSYYVLEPAIDECSDKLDGDQSIQQQYREYADRKAIAESQPDLIDLVIRLTRKVAELEKDTDAAIDGAANALSTANKADYKAGQALTTAELQAENVDMLTDDIVSLDERLGAEEEKSKMITHVLGVSRRCCR